MDRYMFTMKAKQNKIKWTGLYWFRILVEWGYSIDIIECDVRML